MPTIAIVGAGPGLGLSIAKVFGRNGFRVALVSRNQEKLDALAGQLQELGIEAAGFTADITDRPSLSEAFARIKDRFGSVDVLEFSPAPHDPGPDLAIAGPLDVTVENLQPQIDFYLHGAITAIREVLPDMLSAGEGTVLVSTGASSVHPHPMMGNVGPAAAALRNWVLNLHDVLADKGVYVVHVPIAVWIGQGGPDTEADAIAQQYWDLHVKREGAEHLYAAA